MGAKQHSRIRNQALGLVAGVVAMASVLGQSVLAEGAAKPHRLRERGRSLVEAEEFSAVPGDAPRAERCEACSGNANLGYFWQNTWFEVEVEVPRMLSYRVSMRTASPDGSQIQIQTQANNGFTELAVVGVNRSGSWLDYSRTKGVLVSLPAGKQTLRFFNTGGGVNIDFIHFDAVESGAQSASQPAKTLGPAQNPMKGMCSGWWREDEHASVGFQYLEWGQFEPEDDRFDWAYVEEVLNRPGTRGKHFILQFAVDWDYRKPVEANYLGPEWLLEAVGERRGYADPEDSSSREMRATNYNDPRFVAEAQEAIDALVNRLGNDPRCFVIQVGVLGFWGEWHTFPRLDWNPTDKTKASILKSYLPLLERSGLTQVRYPEEPIVEPRVGLGYMNGSATLTDHGKEFGSAVAEQALWKNGPIHGEWPPNTDLDVWKRFFLSDEGKVFVGKGHYTTLLMPERKEILEKLPGWTPEGRFAEMHRRMGYNFQIEEVKHVVSGDSTNLELTITNVGLAPFYRDWEAQLAIIESASSQVVGQCELTADLRSLGPGESRVLSGACQAELSASKDYKIGLRLLQPGADRPKKDAWPLEARNTYIVVANDIDVVPGEWDEQNALLGGWNLIADLQRRLTSATPSAESTSFPFEGSFRPRVGAE